MPDDRPIPIPISLIAPAHNEQDNILRLVGEVEKTLAQIGNETISGEFILVDDCSTDGTQARLLELMTTRPWLRCIALHTAAANKPNGQSAAFHAGIRAARGPLIAFLDADLQNDPADIPRMIALMHEANADMVQGDRAQSRQDNAVRKVGSWVGRTFRRWLLGDTIRDTGCSLRVMKREVALALPLEFRGMHRFIPVTARHLGFQVVETPVTHRPRTAGETKYGLGILPRALPGLRDLFAVRWMRARRRRATAHEIRAGAASTRA